MQPSRQFFVSFSKLWIRIDDRLLMTKPDVAHVHYAPRFCLAQCRPQALALVAYERRTRPEGSGEVSCRLHSCVLRKKNGLA